MNRIVIAIIIAIIAIIAIGFGAWYLSNPPTASPGMTEPLIIKATVQELGGLLYIAEDGGFFARNGLNVTIVYCDTGLACVNSMSDGEAEMAASSEYPVVGIVLKQKNISVIGSIDKYQGQYIVGRRDRNIQKAADLRGKKIGVARGTITEFYLGRFLYVNNIGLQDIIFVNVRPTQYSDSIGNGSVDAVIVPQVYLMPVEERLGSNAIIWQAQSNQNAFGVLTCRNDWIVGHSDTINKLIKSLVQAEDCVLSHPNESEYILKKRLNYSEKYMDTVWPQQQYYLTLDQSLVSAMEDEARWTIANNLTSAKTVPDFTYYIYTKGLEKVKPDALDIW
jgi:NitT/TauT family transport system substrate-binding protein